MSTLTRRLSEIPVESEIEPKISSEVMPAILSQHLERATAVALGETPTQRKANEIIDEIARNPETKTSIGAYIFGQLMTQDANAASASYAQELEVLRRLDPQAMVLLGILINGYCLATNQRMIDNDVIQRSLRQRRKKAGRFKQALKALAGRDESMDIRDEVLDLAAQKEALQLDSRELQAKNAQVAAITQQTLANTATEARKMQDAGNARVDTLKQEIARLERKISKLKKAEASLLENPDLAKVVKTELTDIEVFERRMTDYLTLHLIPRIYPDDKTSCACFANDVRDFVFAVGQIIQDIESEFGIEEREHSLAIIFRALSLNKGRWEHSGCSDPVKISTLFGIFQPLADKKLGVRRWLDCALSHLTKLPDDKCYFNEYIRYLVSNLSKLSEETTDLPA